MVELVPHKAIEKQQFHGQKLLLHGKYNEMGSSHFCH